MTEVTPACGVCVCRHQTSSVLECRLMPPTIGPGQYGVYPKVRPNDYCRGGFRPDEAAIAEREAAKQAIAAAAAPLLGQDGKPLNPPVGDLAEAIAAPAAVAQADPPAQPRSRARRGDAQS